MNVDFPLGLEKAPFPVTISMDDTLDASWFQGSATQSLDVIICSFAEVCRDGYADPDYMHDKIWPAVVSQLLTYDADFDWVSKVRDAILADSSEPD